MPHPKDDGFKRANAQRLHTLEDVVFCCRRNGVTIRSFLPTSGFAIDGNGQVYWTVDPSASEGDRYGK